MFLCSPWAVAPEYILGGHGRRGTISPAWSWNSYAWEIVLTITQKVLTLQSSFCVLLSSIILKHHICLKTKRGEKKGLFSCFGQNYCRVEEETWREAAEGTAAERQTPWGKDPQTAEAVGESESAMQSWQKQLHKTVKRSKPSLTLTERFCQHAAW